MARIVALMTTYVFVAMHRVCGDVINITYAIRVTPMTCATVEQMTSISHLGCARNCEDWSAGICTAFGVFQQKKTCEICIRGSPSGQTMVADKIYYVERAANTYSGKF